MQNILSNTNQKCSVYNNLYAQQNNTILISDLCESIKTGVINNLDFKPLISSIRENINNDAIRKELKNQLIAITFGGVFESSRKSKLIEISGYVTLDFDKIDNVEEYKMQICQLGFVFSCFISPSGNGLKVLIPVKITDTKGYNKLIKQLFKYFNEQIGLVADTSKQNTNDVCFISYDPDIYVNPSALIWEDVSSFELSKDEPNINLKNISKLSSKVESIVSEIEKSKIDITDIYDDWLKIGFALAHEFGEFGREYFHRISKFNPNYNEINADRQYTSCINSQGDGVTIATLFHIVKNFGISKEKTKSNEEFYFWYLNDKGEYKINTALFYSFLDNEGIKRFVINEDDSLIIHIKNKIIKQINKRYIINFLMDFINKLDAEDKIKERLKNTFYANQNLLSETNLYTLLPFEGKLKRDNKTASWLYFQNCICNITQSNISIVSYESLDEYIWESRVIKHDFTSIEDTSCVEKGEFFQFLYDICSNKDESVFAQKLKSICTVIGYLCHDFKDPSNAKCIIFMEEDDSDEPNGGKGKGILLKAISYVVKVTKEDGKGFSGRSEFPYSLIKHDTKVFFIDDVQSFLNFEMFFSFITEGVAVNKKYKDKYFISFEDSPKLVITTNYSLPGEGESHERRKLEFEVSDYYNMDNTPETKFGHLLFNDWANEEWNLFYNLIVNCVQIFLVNGLVAAPSTNLKYKKLRAFAGEEFVQFIEGKLEELINKRINKFDLFNSFMINNDNQKKIQSQRKFTICLRAFGRTFGYDLIETKSGSDYSVQFKKKVE